MRLGVFTCFRWNLSVPESARATTRLLAQATAGMRLLTPAQQEPIWASLRSRLSGSPFSFVDADAWTISGNYEGLYGFLAASYLAKVPFGSAFGYLDLGGASTQIAFVPCWTTQGPITGILSSVTAGQYLWGGKSTIHGSFGFAKSLST